MAGRERQRELVSNTRKGNIPGHDMIWHHIISLGCGRQNVPGGDERRQEGVNDRPHENGHIVPVRSAIMGGKTGTKAGV